MEEKIYLVKRYRRFPNKMFQDKTMKKFDTLMEAQAYSIKLNRESDTRYYVIDDPHTWVELSEEQKRYINKLNKKNNEKQEMS